MLKFGKEHNRIIEYTTHLVVNLTEPIQPLIIIVLYGNLKSLTSNYKDFRNIWFITKWLESNLFNIIYSFFNYYQFNIHLNPTGLCLHLCQHRTKICVKFVSHPTGPIFVIK